MLGSLSDGLQNTLSKIRDAVFVDDSLIKEVTKDVQRTLMKSDVSVSLVLDLSKKIRKRAKEDTPPGLTQKEHLIHIIYEEIAGVLGEGTPDLNTAITTTEEPYVMMLAGLFGSGKTTTTAKIARRYTKRGHNVLMVATDTWRPAAAKQLEQLGEQINVDVYTDTSKETPEEIIEGSKKEWKKYDLVLVDTAGRDSLNEELREELVIIRDAVEADETLLVLSADIGQGAEKLAQTFKENVDITGVIITKLDGTAKGGGALSACHIAEAPIYFIGVGEKVDDLETFDPESFVGRLLGMGDLNQLLEKAQTAFEEDEAEDMAKKMMKGDFDLRDLYTQLESMQSMGPLQKVLDMIPGMGNAGIDKSDIEKQEKHMKQWKHAMDSMTDEELSNPDLIRRDRIKRISQGSGVKERVVRKLLKQYKKSKKMMKKLGGNKRKMKKMMKKMQGGGGGNLPF